MIDPVTREFKYEGYVERVRDAQNKLNEAIRGLPDDVEATVEVIDTRIVSDSTIKERVHISMKKVFT